MKKKSFLPIFSGLFFIFCGQTYSQTYQYQLGNIKIQSTLEATLETHSTVIGSNSQNIQTTPTSRKQTTKRLVELKEGANDIQAIYQIQHIKATIYGGSGESTYDSDNTFERSGNAAMFAIRADPWVGKKMKSTYKKTGSPVEPMDKEALSTWLISIPLLSNNREWSGLLQTSLPTMDWRIGMTWTDSLKGATTSFTNNYKVLGISGQTIVLALSGISNPLSTKPVAALNSANSTSESKGGTYKGTIEFIKATGVIKKMEVMRESESIEEVMNTKISSITTTKIAVINKVL